MHLVIVYNCVCKSLEIIFNCIIVIYMTNHKLFAGHAVRRIRRASGMTQAAMAEALDISPSYLNFIERNQRPITAPVLLRLAERFDFDPRTLSGAAPGGGADALRRRLADPLFADLSIDRSQLEEWIAAAPDGAEAFARAFDRSREGGALLDDPIDTVRREIERWRNHFADLDAMAEALADELRLGSGDIHAAMAERLRLKHQLSLRILPAEVMPDALHRMDLHARQLQLSERLDPASRCFALATTLASLEAEPEIGALVRGAAFTERTPERLFRRHLTGYFAAAVMMPYGRFLRACEASGYDITLLQRRFGAGFEQVAHRLTTLQRVGARGLPFFMIRIDRAGQSSKRYAGASGSPLVEGAVRCPLWGLHRAFDRPGEMVPQLVALHDTRWFTVARTVKSAGGALFSIGLGLEAKFASSLALAHGIDLQSGPAQSIGPGCRACLLPDCPQRAHPPHGHVLAFNERERGLSPFRFATG